MIISKYFALPAETENSEAFENNASEFFISKYLTRHYLKIKSLSQDLLKLPSENETFYLQTENSFNAFTFIPIVAKAQGIKELYASTYSINIRVIESLIELYDQKIVEKITLLISDSLIKRNPTTYDLLSALIKSRENINVIYSWNHSKITLLQTQDNYYIIEGSGNWSENAFIEQYIFTNSKEVFEFRKQIFTNTKSK